MAGLEWPEERCCQCCAGSARGTRYPGWVLGGPRGCWEDAGSVALERAEMPVQGLQRPRRHLQVAVVTEAPAIDAVTSAVPVLSLRTLVLPHLHGWILDDS